MITQNSLRRSFVAVTAGVLLSGTFAPAGDASSGTKTRTVAVPYQGPAAALSSPAGFITLHCHPTFAIGCVRIPTRRTDQAAKIAIADQAGQQVMAMVLDSTDNELAFFCGETNGKIFFPSLAYIEIWLVAGTCHGTTEPSIVTAGQVRVTFFNE